MAYSRRSIHFQKMFTDRRKELRASVTVLFAMTAVLITALFLSAVESVRTQGTRLYFTLLCHSAMDSLFSQYHRPLWEDYRLLGLEHYSDEQLKDEFRGFADPYLEAENYYVLELGDIEISEKALITDSEGEVFEDEILDYMRYGIAVTVWDQVFVKDMLSGVKDGEALSGLQEDYGVHTRSAMRLEEVLEAIGLSVDEQERLLGEAQRAAENYDGPGFRKKLSELKKELSEIPGLTEDYRSRAEALRKELAETREKYELQKKSGELSESTAKALLSEIEKYDAYVAADGERRLEIEEMPGRASDNMAYIDELILLSEEAERRMDEYIPEEGEEVDPGVFWAPVISALSAYEPLQLSIKKGVEDKETEGRLERISELINADLLALLLPDGMEPLRSSHDLKDPPSETAFSGINESRRGIIDRIFIAEYMTEIMNYYGRGHFEDGESLKGSGALELEYILYGGESDHTNLSSAVKDLVLLRTGLNLIHILSDAEKRSEAEQLAIMITGALGFTPIAGIMTFFIMSVWALGQALCDVKALLRGEKVRLMHTRESFSLSLGRLLTFSDGTVEGEGSDDEGLSYADYLRLFLIAGQGSEQDYRCMDMIQLALSAEQTDFRLDRCAVGMELEAVASAGHVFTGTGVFGALKADPPDKIYEISTAVFYAY